MKRRSLKSFFNGRIRLLSAAFLLSTVFYLLPTGAQASEQWVGVDESVVEKIAEEHGRQASNPIINTDQGDLLLFVFLIAGAIGGFAAGYYWRTLTAERERSTTEEEQRVTD